MIKTVALHHSKSFINQDLTLDLYKNVYLFVCCKKQIKKKTFRSLNRQKVITIDVVKKLLS